MEKPKVSLFRPTVGERGVTGLHYAAYCGDLDALVRFLEKGPGVNVADNYRGYTPLHWLADMAATGGPRLEMLRELVSHGVDINVKSTNGMTALMLARAAGSNCGDELALELIALGAKE